MKKYEIITADTIPDLVEKVKEFISNNDNVNIEGGLVNYTKGLRSSFAQTVTYGEVIIPEKSVPVFKSKSKN